MFLQENNLLSYAQLQAKIAEVQTLYSDTAETLKGVEQRLSDMALLIKHMENYRRTLPVYQEYRQAGNKDRFYRQNESALIVHEAAKKALRELGIDGKLPNFAELKKEHDRLTQEKTSLYREYGNLKKQVKEYDTIKTNIDQILDWQPTPEQDRQKTKGKHELLQRKASEEKRKILWSILLLISVCVFLFAAYQLISQYMTYRAAENEYESLAGIAYIEDGETENGADYQSPIDFAALAAINPDIIGWIVIDGTNIDYPIVQGSDNDAYLHKTFSGERNSSGSIFLDCRNAPDFSDRNSIVYGHKMKNGSMFAGLTEYKEQGFYEQHPAFTLYTPDAEYRCEVFAAYVTSGVSETYTLDFIGDMDFTGYINEAVSRSLVKTGVTPAAKDRIVTLSTCDYTYGNARMVVHARLVRENFVENI